jgi:hypothetical protein
VRRLHQAFVTLSRGEVIAQLRGSGVLRDKQPEKTKLTLEGNVRKMASYICDRIDRLHAAGFAVLCVFDPENPAADDKPVLRKRKAHRKDCLDKLNRAVQMDQLHGIPLATLQGCVSVRMLLQSKVITAIQASRGVGVCYAVREADLAIAALVRTGKVHAVVTNDSDLVLHMAQCPTSRVFIIDTRAPRPGVSDTSSGANRNCVQVTEPWKIPEALGVTPQAVCMPYCVRVFACACVFTETVVRLVTVQFASICANGTDYSDRIPQLHGVGWSTLLSNIPASAVPSSSVTPGTKRGQAQTAAAASMSVSQSPSLTAACNATVTMLASCSSSSSLSATGLPGDLVRALSTFTQEHTVEDSTVAFELDKQLQSAFAGLKAAAAAAPAGGPLDSISQALGFFVQMPARVLTRFLGWMTFFKANKVRRF